ncbi:MAG: leucine-rich repeat protein [Clostridiales bacterium]|nr:leucine-rich repeat protein [Clostridiales bacterium]
MQNNLKRYPALLLAVCLFLSALTQPALALETGEDLPAAEETVETDLTEQEETAVADLPEEAQEELSETETAAEETTEDDDSDSGTADAPGITAIGTAIEKDTSYVYVTWEAVGEYDYQILRSTDGGEYALVGYASYPGADETEATYQDAEASLYHTYSYAVCCIDDSGDVVSEYAYSDAHYFPSGDCGDDVTWTLTSEGLLTVSGSGTMVEAWDAGYADWYYIRTEVQAVEIEYGVTSVAPYAFQECTALTNVSIADSVTAIGDCAFYGCTGLTEIAIPEGVTQISYRTFYLCTALASVSLPSTVTAIGDGAFGNCTGLTSLTLPDELTSLGKSALYNCTGLTSLVIPDGVTTLPMNVLYGCTGLTSLTLPDGLTELGIRALFNCSGLTGLELPDTLTAIGSGALQRCSGLSELTIPASVNSIGADAFYDCTGLETVAFLGAPPATLSDWFGNTACTATVPEEYADEWFALDLSAAGSQVTWCCQQTDGSLIWQAPSLTAVSGSSQGVTVTWQALSGVSGYRVYRKTASGSWTALGDTTDTSWLDAVADGETYIYAVTVLDGQGQEASDLSTASAITVTAAPCGSSLTWTWSENTLTVSGTGAMYDLTGQTRGWEALTEKTAAVVLEDGVTSVGAGAFRGMIAVTSVTLPDTVTAVGDSAFYGCTGLTRLTFPAGLTALGTDALSGCTALRRVYFSGDGQSNFESQEDTASVTFYYPAEEYSWTAEQRMAVSSDSVWKGWTPSTGELYTKATPVTTVTQTDTPTVILSWDSVSGVSSYVVLRRAVGFSTWTVLGETDGTSWTDDSPLTGDSQYAVRCYDSDDESYLSWYDIGEVFLEDSSQVEYLDTPEVSLSNAATGVAVTWNAIEGAEGYRIYRKTTGGWTTLEYMTSTSYTDTTASSGTTYYYTVRAYAGSVLSDYETDRTILYLAQPEFTLENTSSGVQVTWSTVSGATSYRVYRKVSGGNSWTRIATVSSSTLTYTDTAVEDGSGTTYYYTVRAVSGNTLGSYDSSKSIVRLAQPTVTLSNASTGVTVKWGAVTGATSYRIYRKTVSGSWQNLGSVSSSTLTYTDTVVADNSGTTYYYTVRAVSGSTLGSYDSSKSIVRLAQPTVTLSNAATGVTVKWGAVTGATGYTVWRKTSGGSWAKITTVSSSTLTYTDTTASSGTTYYYTVRAVCNGTLSSYVTNKSITR